MKTFIIKLFVLCLAIQVSYAQKNIVKVNLSSAALGNAYISYERVIARKLSFQLGINWTPFRNIPFSVSSSSGNNENVLKHMKVTTFGVTPELRLYTSADKTAPKGFYISPYLRYTQASFSGHNYPYLYNDKYDEDTHKSTQVCLSGSASFIGGGVVLGHQWIINELISIDFWILGLGISKADFRLKALPEKMDTRYMKKDSEFASHISDNFKVLNSVEVKEAEDHIQIKSSRTLPALRGLGVNVGIAF